MHKAFRFGVVALVLAAAAGCQQAPPAYGPKPEEMRKALLTLMDTQPDIAIPEFRTSLENDTPVEKNGLVYIGSWNCDPKLMTFDALFSAPNITMYEIAGRFQKDNRGVWMAIPRRVQKTENHDVTEFWCSYEVEPRH